MPATIQRGDLVKIVNRTATEEGVWPAARRRLHQYAATTDKIIWGTFRGCPVNAIIGYTGETDESAPMNLSKFAQALDDALGHYNRARGVCYGDVKQCEGTFAGSVMEVTS